MQKRFLVSVGDAVLMQGNNIILTAKTLIDSGISVETSNTEIRGGKGNQLQAIYYHTGTFNVTLTDAQFRLPYIALNTGSTIVNGGDIWSNETVTLNGTTGTIIGTPVAIAGQAISVWAEYEGVHYTFPVSGNTFSVDGTSIPANSTLCVMYMSTQNAAQSITIPANIVPDRVRLYITADLYGDTSGKGVVGKVQIEVPVAQLSGAQEITMTADGYSNTPLTAMALAYSDSSAVGCSNGAYYAKITEYITGSNWYDGVIGLSIEQGDFELANGATSTLRVWAIRGNNSSFLCNNADLTFESSDTQYANIGDHTGVITTSNEGSTLLTAYITDVPTIEASATLTVTGA